MPYIIAVVIGLMLIICGVIIDRKSRMRKKQKKRTPAKRLRRARKRKEI